ncbi:MAG: acetyltransferase [Betaproteobacteria bacterium]|nr:acetyltransferase [Betaproteobacteria bacterium]
MIYDAFNGDADGICALHQMRLAEPAESTLVTGVKRDIGLLRRIDAHAGDEVLALDIAVEKNAAALAALLDRGVKVRWFDHHHPGDLPTHPNFHATIDTAAEVCTSLLVDRHLAGAWRPWAVAAAFGDNLHAAARLAAEPLEYREDQLDALRELGECLNYNGYGDSPEDLHFHPADLYRALHPYTDPFAFMAESGVFRTLRAGYAEDMALARNLTPDQARAGGVLFVLPDAAWARRVSGVYANDLATAHPARAHALLTRSPKGHYVVSVRAPLNRRSGADELCRQFDTGGGRKAAAGINVLPEADIPAFASAFFTAYPDN